MDTRLLTIAQRYADRRGARRRGTAPVEVLVQQRFLSPRRRRTDDLLDLALEVGRLHTDGCAADLAALRDEARDLAFPNGSADIMTDAGRALSKRLYFDLLAARALNAGKWLGDLRLRPGQRALLVDGAQGKVLGVETVPGHPFDAFQHGALAVVAMLRTAIASTAVVDVVAHEDIPSLPQRVLDAYGCTAAELAARHDGTPFEGVLPLGSSAPFVLVIANGHVILAPSTSPWHAIADAQEKGASFGDAIAVGVLMMAADAGFVPVPPEFITPSGVAETIEKARQEQRLATKLARWPGLLRDATRRDRTAPVSRPADVA